LQNLLNILDIAPLKQAPNPCHSRNSSATYPLAYSGVIRPPIPI